MTVWAFLAWWFAVSALALAVYAWLGYRRSQARLRALRKEAERVHSFHEAWRAVTRGAAHTTR